MTQVNRCRPGRRGHRRDEDVRGRAWRSTTCRCSVAPGEVYGILGPNGAGKTTFLRMLFGLIRPDSGTIRVFDRTWADDDVADPRRRRRLHREPAVLPVPHRSPEPRGTARCSTAPACRTGRRGARHRRPVRPRRRQGRRLLLRDAPTTRRRGEPAARARGCSSSTSRPTASTRRHPRHAGTGQAAGRQRPDGAAQLAPHGRGRGDLRQRHDHDARDGGLPRHHRRPPGDGT